MLIPKVADALRAGMGLRRITAFIVLVWFIGLGTMFGFVLVGTTALGGTITVDMTTFDEMWFEYGLVLLTTGTLPYVLYVAERELLDLE